MFWREIAGARSNDDIIVLGLMMNNVLSAQSVRCRRRLASCLWSIWMLFDRQWNDFRAKTPEVRRRLSISKRVLLP
jgi:hypothetical protein